MKREKRNEHPETDDQREEDPRLGVGGHRHGVRRRGQLRHVKSGATELHEEGGQPGEQDQAAKAEVNGDFPRGRSAVAAAVHSDHDERRDQRQLVEGVEEEKVGGDERAHGAGGNEQDAHVIEPQAAAGDRRRTGQQGG